MIPIMSDSLIEALSRLMEREQKLATGQVLFRVGDPVVSLFLVLRGSLRLTRPLAHGSELTLQRAGAGAILAEASLFAEHYHCDASAAEASLVRIVPRQRVETAFAENQDLARSFARHLAHHVQRARAHAEILSMKTVAERVDAWIFLSDGVLPPKGRWRQIASEINVSPEALYRELARRR